MGDFLIDLRKIGERSIAAAAESLRFYNDLHVTEVSERDFGFVLTSPDEPRLWAPAWSADKNTFVAICGRVSLGEQEWAKAASLEGQGGLACKYLLDCYQKEGVESACEQSGHFVIVIFDRAARCLFLITDRWGIAPAFKYEAGKGLVMSSHPDTLADSVGEGSHLDFTSLAEFVLTCKISYPYSYYTGIRSLPFASMTRVSWANRKPSIKSTCTYFDASGAGAVQSSPEELAEELVAGFRTSLANRTLPLLGPGVVALSGGLDSRTLLCATPEGRQLASFCCYDEENEEFRIAREVAESAGSQFVPLKRDYDYYAHSARKGVRISAGMGCVASNHFLGFREELRALGSNLITGCYCDYVFKGLALNKKVNRWTRRESIGDFSFSYYARHFSGATPLARSVQKRLEEGMPLSLRGYDSEDRIAEVERRRMFPLSYEEDNAARTIPQRVMGWDTPIAENQLLDAQMRMSTAMKLNRSAFLRMTEKLCGSEIMAIDDANTGQPATASWLRMAYGIHMKKLQARGRKLRGLHASSGSWLNWSSYINRSGLIREMWESPNREADDIFQRILGKEGYFTDIARYSGKSRAVFLQLLTLKLWLDQRLR